MSQLYPPILSGRVPAFYGNKLVVPYAQNQLIDFSTDVQGFKLKLYTIYSNTILFLTEASSFTEAEVTFTLSQEQIEKLKIGQFYKLQIAYLNEDGNGIYSSVATVKYTAEPSVTISGLENRGGLINSNRQSYLGTFVHEGDQLEKEYSYTINLYDFATGEIVYTKQEVAHNSDNNTPTQSWDEFKIPLALADKKTYELEYIVTTVNNLEVTSPRYKIMASEIPWTNDSIQLEAHLNFENGYIELSVKQANDATQSRLSGNFKIVRTSSKDNFQLWDEILSLELVDQHLTDIIQRDYTIEQGITYRYALQKYFPTTGLNSTKIESTAVRADFEHAFLYDGKRQLKIKYNPKVSSFKNDVLESKVDTIGGQYPFIFRNGNVFYKEFPISGLISYQSDEEFLFVNEDDLTVYKKTTGKFGEDIKYTESLTDLTTDNIYSERQFKLDALSWLNNGEIKLFKSPVEGNYLVRLLNVSLSPTDSVGRMLHTFNATAYEVLENTYENLLALHFSNTSTIIAAKKDGFKTVEIKANDASAVGTELIDEGDGPISSLNIEGAIPGDIYTIILSNGSESDIVIGPTGKYSIKEENGVSIQSIKIKELSPTGVRSTSSAISYGYTQSTLEAIDQMVNMKIVRIPCQLLIPAVWRGDSKIAFNEVNILDQIQTAKDKLVAIPWVRFSKRKIEENGNQAQEKNPAYVYKTETGEYIDGWSKRNIAVVDNIGENCFAINGNIVSLDKKVTYEITDLPTNAKVQLGPNVFMEICYEKEIYDYAIEESSRAKKYGLTLPEQNKFNVDNWIKYLCEYYDYCKALNNIIKSKGGADK